MVGMEQLSKFLNSCEPVELKEAVDELERRTEEILRKKGADIHQLIISAVRAPQHEPLPQYRTPQLPILLILITLIVVLLCTLKDHYKRTKPYTLAKEERKVIEFFLKSGIRSGDFCALILKLFRNQQRLRTEIVETIVKNTLTLSSLS